MVTAGYLAVTFAVFALLFGIAVLIMLLLWPKRKDDLTAAREEEQHATSENQP